MNQSFKPQAKSNIENTAPVYFTPEKRTKPRDLSPRKKPFMVISDENMAEITSKVSAFKLF